MAKNRKNRLTTQKQESCNEDLKNEHDGDVINAEKLSNLFLVSKALVYTLNIFTDKQI